MKLFSKLKHTLESCWLCIRFPFLYPRNRFTGKNRKNVLGHQLWKLKERSIQNISITGKLVNDETKKNWYSNYANFTNYTVKLDKDTKALTISNYNGTVVQNLKSLLWSDDRFEILGLDLVFAISGNPIVQVIVETKNKEDKSNYGFHYESVEMITNKWKYFWYKFLKWIDEEILDRILFIPTYTELDSMPAGWKKAFGIQMCKEIKAALLKYGRSYLRNYRIMQIKEKFGMLCWYDENSVKEVWDITSKYEDISYKTCIVCGAPATKLSSGWICPYCDEHFPKNEPVYKSLNKQ